MSEFLESVSRHFDFLVDAHGLKRSVESPNRVRYVGRKVYFEISTYPGDGPGVHFGRIGYEESISLEILIGVLRTADGSDQQSARSTEGQLAYLSEGLHLHAGSLIAGSDDLYGKLRELRFWHVGHWTRGWGTTIQLSPDDVSRHRELVACIAKLLPGVGSV